MVIFLYPAGGLAALKTPIPQSPTAPSTGILLTLMAAGFFALSPALLLKTASLVETLHSMMAAGFFALSPAPPSITAQ